MTILDGIDADVAAAIADIFKDGTHQFTGVSVSDDRGGQRRSTSTQAVKVLVTDYKDFVRATSGIPSNERKVMVQGFGMSPTPSPDDVIVQGEEAWQVVEVSKDPASAIYTCRCRPVAVPAGIIAILVDAGASVVAQPGRPPISALISASSSVEALAGTPVSLVRVSAPSQSIANPGTPRVDVLINAGAAAIAQPHGAVVDESGAGEPIGLLLALTKAPSPVVGAGEPMGLLLTLTKAA
ncbi:MAG: hypothetical protein AAGL19_03390 [Pseudomonadota bacterium]